MSRPNILLLEAPPTNQRFPPSGLFVLTLYVCSALTNFPSYPASAADSEQAFPNSLLCPSLLNHTLPEATLAFFFPNVRPNEL